MVDFEKVLKFLQRKDCVDVMIDKDKTSLIDIVVEYEDETKKQGIKLKFYFPIL